MFFFFYCYDDHRDLHVLTHSFPTRRSSDLEIFDPRPVYSWPLTPEDDESGNEFYDPETRSMGAMLADARPRDALAAWRKRTRERVQADGNWTIELDTRAQLNEAIDAIGPFFSWFVSIGLGGKEIYWVV